MPEDWNAIATYLGYKDEHDMLYDMYVVQGMAGSEIGRRVGAQQPTIMRRLRNNDIPIRPPGGANAIPRLRYKLHLLDQRRVFKTANVPLGILIGGSPSVVYKYKRGVKGDRLDAFHTNRAVLGNDPTFE